MNLVASLRDKDREASDGRAAAMPTLLDPARVPLAASNPKSTSPMTTAHLTLSPLSSQPSFHCYRCCRAARHSGSRRGTDSLKRHRPPPPPPIADSPHASPLGDVAANGHPRRWHPIISSPDPCATACNGSFVEARTDGDDDAADCY